jgi:nucleotide-binding universal stress UspA family protein
MFNKILVPLDGSTLAEQALNPALGLAQWSGGEVILMRVPMYSSSNIPISPAYEYPWPQDVHTPIQGESAKYLKNLRQSLAGERVPIRSLVVNGDRAGAIVDTAKMEKADLIVMSTHGRTGLSRWVLGSVTSRVLSNAPCPVLVIHKPTPIAHILITLDGSILAENALAPGLVLARAFSSKVTLLRVIPDPDSGFDPFVMPENIALQTDLLRNEASLQHAENYLQDLIAIHQTKDIEINGTVTSGLIASTILDFADENEVDLIAMTTHGRTGLGRWIFGSVTEKVLYKTSCAMLIIRPPQQ